MGKGGRKSSPLLSELERLKEENARLNETIKNVSFNENPDIFCVRKDSPTYFANVTTKEARVLLSSEPEDLKINIAWENGKED